MSSCGGCHTLSAAGTNGVTGGRSSGLSFSDVVRRAAAYHDGGAGMPAFGDTLSSDEIAAVSAVVADATR